MAEAEPEDTGHYRIAGKRLPKELVDEYLSLRRGSGLDRVHYHRVILSRVGEPYGGAWWRAFEEWVEAELEKPHWVQYYEKREGYRRSHPLKCHRCGRRFSVREAFLKHLEAGCDAGLRNSEG